MSDRTTEKDLLEVHKLLTEKIKIALKTDEIAPAMVTAVSKFLKDNHIELTPGSADERELRNLMADLPYDLEDDVNGYVH